MNQFDFFLQNSICGTSHVQDSDFFKVKFVILISKNVPCCIFKVNESVWTFYKNRLVDPRSQRWWFIMANIVIMIEKTIIRCISKVNGSIWVSHENRLVYPQDVMVAMFYSHYNPDTWKPLNAFWTRLSKLEFFQKNRNVEHQRYIWGDFDA